MAHRSASQCAPLPSVPPTHAPPGRSSTRAKTRPATASTAPRKSALTSSSPRSSTTSSCDPHSGAQHVACTSQPPSHNSNLPHPQPHRSRKAASRACIQHPYTRLPATHSGLAVLRAVLHATCAVLQLRPPQGVIPPSGVSASRERPHRKAVGNIQSGSVESPKRTL